MDRKKQVVALVAVLAVVAVVAVVKGTGSNSSGAASGSEADLGASTSAQSTEASLPMMLELGSVGCVPCDMMEPIIAELKEELAGKVDVTFTDVAKAPEVADQYDVVTIPTQVFVDSSGEELFRHVGFYPKDEVLAKMRELEMLD